MARRYRLDKITGKRKWYCGKPPIFQTRKEEEEAYLMYLETQSLREVADKYELAMGTISTYVSKWMRDPKMNQRAMNENIASSLHRLEEGIMGHKDFCDMTEDEIMNRPNPQKIDKFTLNDKSIWKK